MKLTRRPLKTLPWEKKSTELRQATQRWIDSGGDPKVFKDVERLTKEIRALAGAATPSRPRVKTSDKRNWFEAREERDWGKFIRRLAPK